MAGKTTTTALSTAMQGGKVSDKAAQSALGQAVGKIANLTKRAENSKEALMETGTLVLHGAETQGSLFLASPAEGYFGEDRMKIGAVDLRAPVGLLAQGYGLYETMMGSKGSGAHVLALGTGVMGSWLASVARNAGRTLAEKRNASAQSGGQAPATAPPAVVMQGAPMLQGPSLFPEPGLSGPMREVLLTPEPMAEGQDELGRMRPRKVRRIVRRMERREDRREQREEPEPEPEEEVLQGDELGRGGRRRRRGGGGKKGGGGQGRGRFTRSKKDDQDEDDSDDS